MALLLFLLGTGVLEVTTPHYGATVSVDREPRGTTPINPLTLPAGLHLVEVHLRGRPSFSRLVFLPPGERVVLDVRLPDAEGRETPGESSPYAPPPWQVAGRVGLSATHIEARGDLDLDQRWALAAREPVGPGTHLRIEATAATDLAGDGTFVTHRGLRLRTQGERTRLTLEGARLDARPGPLRLAAGRLALTGPDRQPLGLDGAQAELSVTDHLALTARAGRRFDPLDHPSEGAAGGLDLRLAGRHVALDIRQFFNEIHYFEAQTRWHHTTHTLTAQATVAAAELMATRFDLQWRGPLHLGLTHHHRSRLFNRPLDLIGLLPPEAPREQRAALTLEAEGLRGQLEAHLPERPSARQPTVVQGHLAARTLIDGLGVALSTVLADAPRDDEPALNAHARLALTSHQRAGPAQLAAELGLEALDLHRGDGARRTHLRPQGHLRLVVELLDPVDLILEGGARAVHPMWSPGGEPLLTGQLALRLR